MRGDTWVAPYEIATNVGADQRNVSVGNFLVSARYLLQTKKPFTTT
jgi:hypothetical protein